MDFGSRRRKAPAVGRFRGPLAGTRPAVTGGPGQRAGERTPLASSWSSGPVRAWVVADASGLTPYYRDEQGHIHSMW